MQPRSNSIRSILLAMALCVTSGPAVAAAQKTDAPAVASSRAGYRIAGTVVSKTDGRPLARTRITVRDTKDSKKFQSLVTGEDGKYEFGGLPTGKFSLTGATRGFISASYDQHEQYSTAIVTGAGLDTESLVLRLAPDAVIAGKVLDEANEPVRSAQVTVYYDDHSSGVDQIRQFRSAQANDLGEYEVTPLQPGTYFLSANGKPWYAIHPRSETNHSQPDNYDNGDSNQPVETPATVDRSLDVAYPVTYYPGVTDSDDAMPIPIRGGERVEADIHLTPVPSLRLLFRMPGSAGRGNGFPTLEQPAFDSSTYFHNIVTTNFPSGMMEVSGVPAGRYNLRLRSPDGSLHEMNGLDLTKDGEEIDTTKADAVSKVKFLVQVPGEPTLPAHLSVELRAGSRTATHAQAIDAKGEAEMEQVAAGKYEVVSFGGGKPYSIAHISAEGAEVSGHTISVAAGSSPTVSLALVGGSVDVQGKVTKAGKGVAGAMVVLVPKNVELDHDLFRRDQSDLDGTFLLRNVVPGSYMLLAIENGWDLDWSRPGVISAYLKSGRKIEVRDQGGATMNVAEAIEEQSK